MARNIRKFITKAVWGLELDAMREEHGKLVDEVAELKTALTGHVHAASSTALDELNKAIAEIAEIKTALGAHTHGGVTTGANTSAAPGAITYTAPASATIIAGNNETAAPDAITWVNPEAAKVE